MNELTLMVLIGLFVLGAIIRIWDRIQETDWYQDRCYEREQRQQREKEEYEERRERAILRLWND